MIRVTLELIPGGIGEPEQLGVIEIARSVSSVDPKRGDYTYELFKKRKRRRVYAGQIRGFPRLAYHPWNLVYEILLQINEGKAGRI